MRWRKRKPQPLPTNQDEQFYCQSLGQENPISTATENSSFKFSQSISNFEGLELSLNDNIIWKENMLTVSSNLFCANYTSIFSRPAT